MKEWKRFPSQLLRLRFVLWVAQVCVVHGGTPVCAAGSYLWPRPPADTPSYTPTHLHQVGLPLFGGRSWALSTTLYHQHIGMRGVSALDCLHYCQPGLPQVSSG